MIGVFADPYPDEIDYSIFARTIERLGYANQYHGMQELFGNRSIRPIIGLQSGLRHLLSKLPYRAAYSFSEMVSKHSLVPFYRPFYPAEQIQRITDAMYEGNMAGLSNLLSSTLYNIPSHKYLNYCPVCAKCDRKQFGETYWHRLHQIDGIYVCGKHKCWLEKSSIKKQDLRSFVVADDVVNECSSNFLDLTNASDRNHLLLAQNAGLLLNKKLKYDNELIQARYRKLLFDKQLAIYTGSIRIKQAVNYLQQFYGHEFLDIFGCSLQNDSKRNWLGRLLEPNSTGQAHPLQHLLLITALEHSCKQFFQIDPVIRPFDFGPWVCLSPALCPDRLKSVITEVHIGVSRKQQRRPRGIFVCPTCGYTYSRIASDQIQEDEHSGKTLNYGHLWNTQFCELWSDDDLTIAHKASILGIGIDTFKRQAIRLGLASCDTGKVSEIFHVSDISRYQSRWLTILEANPNVGTAELIQKYGDVYWKLYLCCVDWLMNHSPDTRHGTYHREKNWSQIDEKLRPKIPILIESMKNIIPPRRVTINAIGMRLGWNDGSIYKDLSKMPLTKSLIEKYTETYEEFAKRRITVLATQFRTDNYIPTKSEYIKMAGLSRRIQIPSVMRHLEKQLTELKYNSGD